MKQFILYDILNNMYYWEYRGERGFDADVQEATKYASIKDVEKALYNAQKNSEYLRILEIKEVYFIN